MRRRPPPEEIQLLSTSFLDLLCCGLCSVVLLWVLTGTGTKARPEAPFGFVQIGQNGIWHLEMVEVSDDGGKTWPHKFVESRDHLGNVNLTVERESEAVRNRIQSELKLTLSVREGGAGDNDFAGMLALAADRNTTNVLVRVKFNVCGFNSDIHVIRVMGQSGTRLIHDAVTHTRQEILEDALRNPVLNNIYKSVRGNMPYPAANKEEEGTIMLEIRGGLILYTPPSTTD